jgi:hypothetical protein
MPFHQQRRRGPVVLSEPYEKAAHLFRQNMNSQYATFDRGADGALLSHGAGSVPGRRHVPTR